MWENQWRYSVPCTKFYLLFKSRLQSSYKSSPVITHPGVAAQHSPRPPTPRLTIMNFTILILPRAVSSPLTASPAAAAGSSCSSPRIKIKQIQICEVPSPHFNSVTGLDGLDIAALVPPPHHLCHSSYRQPSSSSTGSSAPQRPRPTSVRPTTLHISVGRAPTTWRTDWWHR